MGEQIEERMRAEYLATFHPRDPYETNVHLGWPPEVDRNAPDALKKRAEYMVALLKADAVVRIPGGAIVYEFAVWRPQAKVGQLLVYWQLLPQTPGYEDLDYSEIHPVIVIGVDDPHARELAKRVGIEVKEYRPPWLEAALTARRGRQT